jgi:predicted  nucleic acid-binding Zn-ribbon protein
MILALWDHMLRMWQYRNNALHKDDSTRVARFKIEALDRDIARLAVRHNDLRSKLHGVQERHMERREHIKTLQHNSRQCWASLAKLYLDEAENRIETDTHLLEQHLQGRVGVG